jgi:hypothetical protein
VDENFWDEKIVFSRFNPNDCLMSIKLGFTVPAFTRLCSRSYMVVLRVENLEFGLQVLDQACL